MEAHKLGQIFVVDDERSIAESVTKILQKSGFSARAFFDPFEALAAAQSAAPDLLISDVVMPQLSGIELAIRLTKLCPECKVLLFSGQAYTADLLRNARQQGHDFTLLSKPISPSELLKQIRMQES